MKKSFSVFLFLGMLFLFNTKISAYYFKFINQSNLTVTVNVEWFKLKRYYDWRHASHRHKRVKCNDEKALKSFILNPNEAQQIHTDCGLISAQFSINKDDMKNYAYIALVRTAQALSNKGPVYGVAVPVELANQIGDNKILASTKSPTLTDQTGGQRENVTYTIKIEGKNIVILKDE